MTKSKHLPLTLEPIGAVHSEGEAYSLQIHPEYRPALAALEGFSHIAVLWWFDEFDSEEGRNVLQYPAPYVQSPEIMGVFATRGPVRPNPIALSVCQILSVDEGEGVVHLAYIDAHDGSPLLDIKPYTPSLDRVESPRTPDWCAHWPTSLEASAHFDWEKEFNG